MRLLHGVTALLIVCGMAWASATTAQETAQTVLAELAARSDADVPTLGECDFRCEFRKEVWMVHSRTFCPTAMPRGVVRGFVYGLKADAAEGLDFQFPSGAFSAIVSRLEPITLHHGVQDIPVRLLPAAVM